MKGEKEKAPIRVPNQRGKEEPGVRMMKLLEI